MAAKFIIVSLFVASVYGSGGYSSFSYGVSDPQTGDVKDQHEKRVSDSVVGKYSLLESDGTKRIVEYAANAATGFNAVVRKEPAVSVHPSGPHASLAGSPLSHGPLTHSISLAHRPIAPGLANSASLASVAGSLAHPAPLAPLAHSAPLAPFAGAGPLAHPGVFAHHGALAHPGTLAHSSANTYSGALAHHGSLTLPSTLAHPSSLNHHPDNLAYPGYASFAGINGYGNPIAGNLGAPNVSHYSHSIVHDPARPYPGPYAGINNGAYGSAYGGWVAAHGSQGAYGAPLSHGSANHLANGLAGPHAYSYVNSVAHPSSLAHGTYGAQGLGASLTW